MDAPEILARVFVIGQQIYDAERTRRRSKQRSSELKELGEKIAPNLALLGPPEENPTDNTAGGENPPKIASQSALNVTELPTSEETVRELKRRLGKEIYRLEMDLQEGLKIAGKACDCAEYKHSFGIEATAEELIGKEPDNPVYREVISWYRGNGPNMTLEASASGQYDSQYPRLAGELASFRKRIMGTDTPAVLISDSQKEELRQRAEALRAKLGQPSEPELSLEDAKNLAAEEAAKSVEARWH